MLDNLNVDFAPAASVVNNLINKVSGFLSWKIGKDTPENKAIDIFIEEVKNSNCDPTTKLILIGNAKVLMREYSNKVNIVKECQHYLNENAHPENIEDDWLHLFMDKARLISNNEAQKLWGKILAGEANKPGSISRKLLSILSYMDKETAEDFTNVCRFVIDAKYKNGFNANEKFLFISHEYMDSYYIRHGITFDGLRSLQNCGLIDMIQNRNFVVGYSFHSEEPILGICYGKDSIDFLNGKYSINQGVVIFTKAGKELFNILDVELVDDFWEKVVKPSFLKVANR